MKLQSSSLFDGIDRPTNVPRCVKHGNERDEQLRVYDDSFVPSLQKADTNLADNGNSSTYQQSTLIVGLFFWLTLVYNFLTYEMGSESMGYEHVIPAMVALRTIVSYYVSLFVWLGIICLFGINVKYTDLQMVILILLVMASHLAYGADAAIVIEESRDVPKMRVFACLQSVCAVIAALFVVIFFERRRDNTFRGMCRKFFSTLQEFSDERRQRHPPSVPVSSDVFYKEAGSAMSASQWQAISSMLSHLYWKRPQRRVLDESLKQRFQAQSAQTIPYLPRQLKLREYGQLDDFLTKTHKLRVMVRKFCSRQSELQNSDKITQLFSSFLAHDNMESRIRMRAQIGPYDEWIIRYAFGKIYSLNKYSTVYLPVVTSFPVVVNRYVRSRMQPSVVKRLRQKVLERNAYQHKVPYRPDVYPSFIPIGFSSVDDPFENAFVDRDITLSSREQTSRHITVLPNSEVHTIFPRGRISWSESGQWDPFVSPLEAEEEIPYEERVQYYHPICGKTTLETDEFLDHAPLGAYWYSASGRVVSLKSFEAYYALRPVHYDHGKRHAEMIEAFAPNLVDDFDVFEGVNDKGLNRCGDDIWNKPGRVLLCRKNGGDRIWISIDLIRYAVYKNINYIFSPTYFDLGGYIDHVASDFTIFPGEFCNDGSVNLWEDHLIKGFFSYTRKRPHLTADNLPQGVVDELLNASRERQQEVLNEYMGSIESIYMIQPSQDVDTSFVAESGSADFWATCPSPLAKEFCDLSKRMVEKASVSTPSNLAVAGTCLAVTSGAFAVSYMSQAEQTEYERFVECVSENSKSNLIPRDIDWGRLVALAGSWMTAYQIPDRKSAIINCVSSLHLYLAPYFDLLNFDNISKILANVSGIKSGFKREHFSTQYDDGFVPEWVSGIYSLFQKYSSGGVQESPVRAAVVLFTSLPILCQFSWKNGDVVNLIRKCTLCFKGADLAADIWSSMKTIMDEIVCLVSGKSTDYYRQLDIMYADAEVYSKNFATRQLQVNQSADDMHLPPLQDIKRHYIRTLQLINNLLKTCPSNSRLSTMMFQRKVNVELWMLAVSDAILNQQTRPDPFVFSLCGNGGVGKSFVAHTLLEQLHVRAQISDIKKIAMIGPYMGKFCDTVTNDTTAWLFDDFANANTEVITSVQGNPGASLWDLTGGTPVPVSKAAVEDKGRVVSRADFGAICSNRDDFGASQITCNQTSLFRRLGAIFKVTAHPDVLTNGKLDHKKIVQWNIQYPEDATNPVKSWMRFHRCLWSTATNPDTSVSYGYQPDYLCGLDFLEHLYDLYDEHLSNIRLSNATREQKSIYCSRCRKYHLCCKCGGGPYFENKNDVSDFVRQSGEERLGQFWTNDTLPPEYTRDPPEFHAQATSQGTWFNFFSNTITDDYINHGTHVTKIQRSFGVAPGGAFVAPVKAVCDILTSPISFARGISYSSYALDALSCLSPDAYYCGVIWRDKCNLKLTSFMYLMMRMGVKPHHAAYLLWISLLVTKCVILSAQQYFGNDLLSFCVLTTVVCSNAYNMMKGDGNGLFKLLSLIFLFIYGIADCEFELFTTVAIGLTPLAYFGYKAGCKLVYMNFMIEKPMCAFMHYAYGRWVEKNMTKLGQVVASGVALYSLKHAADIMLAKPNTFKAHKSETNTELQEIQEEVYVRPAKIEPVGVVARKERKPFFHSTDSRDPIIDQGDKSRSTTLENLQILLKKNLYFFTVELDDGDVLKGNMLFVCPGYGLMSEHYMDSGSQSFKFTFIQGDRHVVAKIDKSSMRPLPGKDLMLVVITAPNTPVDLTPYLMEDAIRVQDHAMSYMHRDRRTLDEMKVVVTGPSKDLQHDTMRFEGYEYLFPDGRKSQPGSCGSVVYTRYSGGATIVGLHNCGFNGKGRCSKIVRSEVLEAKRYLMENCGGSFGATFFKTEAHKEAPIHPKNFSNRVPEECNLSVVGSLGTNKHEKAGLVVSPHVELFKEKYGYEPTKGPVVMKSSKNHETEILVGSGHLFDGNNEFREIIVSDFLTNLESEVIEKLPGTDCILRPLTLDEVINGIDGNHLFRHLKFNTSAGFPFNCAKHKLFDVVDGKHRLKSEYNDEFSRVCNRAKQGYRSGYPFTACLKDELRKFHRIETPRQFYAGSLYHLMLHSMYFTPLIKVVENFFVYFETFSGVDPLSPDYDMIFRNISRFGTSNGIALDLSSCDATLQPFFRTMARDVLIRLASAIGYSSDDIEMCYILFDEILATEIIVNGVTIVTSTLLVSGTLLTNLVTSLAANSLMWRYSLAERGILQELHQQGKQFRDVVAMAAMGDDSLGCCIDDSILDNLILAELYSRFGMEATDPNKERYISKFYDIMVTPCIQRVPVFNPDIGFWVGFLSPDSLGNAICHTRKKDSEDERLTRILSIMNDIRIESTPKGKEYYDERKQVNLDVLEILGVPVPPHLNKTYEQAVLDIREHGGNREGFNDVSFIDDNVFEPESGEHLGEDIQEPASSIIAMDDVLQLQETKDISITEFLKRNVVLNTQTYTNGLIYQQFLIMSDYLNHPSVHPKIRGSAILNGSISATFNFTCSQAIYGKIMVFLYPLEKENTTMRIFNSVYNNNHEMRVATAMALPHAIITLPEEKTVNIEVPLWTRTTGFALTRPLEGRNTIGVGLTSIGRVRHVQGAPESITMVLSACMMNPVLSGASSRFYKESGDVPRGRIGRVLSAAASYADIAKPIVLGLTKIPALLAQASEYAFLAGLSRPSNLVVTGTYNDQVGLMSATNVSEIVKTFAIDAVNQVALGPFNPLNSADEMDFIEIITRPNYFGMATWTKGGSENTTLFKIPVNPTVMFRDGNIGKMTSIGAVSSMFQVWNGSIEYTVEVICSSLHSGTIDIAYDPYRVDTPLEDSHYVQKITMDIKQTKKVTFIVNWSVPEALLQCRTVDNALFETTAEILPGVDNGGIHIYVRVPLTSSAATTTQDANVLVTMRALPNMQFGIPRRPYGGWALYDINNEDHEKAGQDQTPESATNSTPLQEISFRPRPGGQGTGVPISRTVVPWVVPFTQFDYPTLVPPKPMIPPHIPEAVGNAAEDIESALSDYFGGTFGDYTYQNGDPYFPSVPVTNGPVLESSAPVPNIFSQPTALAPITTGAPSTAAPQKVVQPTKLPTTQTPIKLTGVPKSAPVVAPLAPAAPVVCSEVSYVETTPILHGLLITKNFSGNFSHVSPTQGILESITYHTSMRYNSAVTNKVAIRVNCVSGGGTITFAYALNTSSTFIGMTPDNIILGTALYEHTIGPPAGYGYLKVNITVALQTGTEAYVTGMKMMVPDNIAFRYYKYNQLNAYINNSWVSWETTNTSDGYVVPQGASVPKRPPDTVVTCQGVPQAVYVVGAAWVKPGALTANRMPVGSDLRVGVTMVGTMNDNSIWVEREAGGGALLDVKWFGVTAAVNGTGNTRFLRESGASVVEFGDKINSHKLLRTCFLGESISNMRTLLKRYEFVGSYNSTMLQTFVVHMYKGNTVVSPTSHWIKKCFLGIRGGIRHKFIMRSDKPTIVKFQHSIGQQLTGAVEVVFVDGLQCVTVEFPYYCRYKYMYSPGGSEGEGTFQFMATENIYVEHYIAAAEDTNCVYFTGGPLVYQV